ncbi:MAG: ATP-dependent Clp protease adapter ClpS [Actinobacteria bacterium]|nr:MAG: ATP-dependent Clp protease adapter ClpS [Actinomycetota bacterium]
MAGKSVTEPQYDEQMQNRLLYPWRAVVWNDAVNLMEYVSLVFQRHFGYQPAHADQLMRDVHEQGRAVVAIGMRERIEADVLALHGYGLRATLEPNE